MLLQDKTVFVSGGSRGLGRAFCAAFAEHGANVAFNYAHDSQAAAETVAQIESTGRRALAFQASVLDERALKESVNTVESTLGPLDALVNNAGISQPLPFALTEEEDWDKVMDINSKGQYMVARAVLPGMIRRRKGVMLNIGSLAGLRIIEAPIHYAASKAAAKGFTEALCKEVSRYGIRVNCLAPGLLDDGVGLNLPQHRLQDYVSFTALGRVGKMSEVARLAAFLISDRNSYMNGETIVMSGGF
jgi:NAD(P)-dependent dehydrogenase (short-subunit alcohol dehydrogenase family)